MDWMVATQSNWSKKNEILFIHIENDKNDLKAVIMLAINASPLRITYSLN